MAASVSSSIGSAIGVGSSSSIGGGNTPSISSSSLVSKLPSMAPTLPTLPPTISTISSSASASSGGGAVPSSVADPLEPSCDSYGVCYEVALKCTDTKIVVNVQTSRPFHGRIYALGRSETCNLNVRNNQQFTLDISLGGQDCNTQSVVSEGGGS